MGQRLGLHEKRDRCPVTDGLSAFRSHLGHGRACREHDSIRPMEVTLCSFRTNSTTTLEHDPRGTLVRYQNASEREKLLEKHTDQCRQINPALPGIENCTLRGDCACIDTGRDTGDFGCGKPLRVIGKRNLVAIGRVDLVALVIRIPGQATIEAKPFCVGIPRRQRRYRSMPAIRSR